MGRTAFQAILICLLGWLLVTQPLWGKQKVTIFGDDGYVPYSYSEDNVAKGIYVHILREAFQRMTDYQVKIEMLPWKRGLKEIELGHGFAIFPPYFWPKKRPYIEPYSEPIFQEKLVAICQPKVLQRPRAIWPDDFIGLTIGTNLGYLTPGPRFFEAVKQSKIKLVESKDTNIGMKMLLLNRTDCYVNSFMSIRWVVGHLKREGYPEDRLSALKIGIVISQKWAYLGFRAGENPKYPFKSDFILKFNQAIRAMKREGRIEEIVNEFFE